MKKFYLALMAVAAIAFTSCVKDNGNNPNENPQKTAKFASVEYNFTVSISNAFASVADMRLVYTGEDGKLKEEIVNGSMADRVIKTKAPVDSIRVQVFYAKKEKADFTESNLFVEENAKGDKIMNIQLAFEGSCTTLNEKGNDIQYSSFLNTSSTLSMPIAEVERFVEKYSTTARITRTLRFDSTGYVIK